MSDPRHRRLRTPNDDDATLIDPPLADAASLIARNKAAGERFDRLGIFPSDFRTIARIYALAPAAARDGVKLSKNDLSRPLVMSGHQPELFHPGVWFKEFLLSSLANSVGGIALHLAIDNDVVHSTSIRVPTGNKIDARVIDVAFDAPTVELQWELREVVDRHVFGNFAMEVRRAFKFWSQSPDYRDGMIIDRLWPYTMEAFDEHPTEGLGALFAIARHRLERDLNLQSHYFAISQLGGHRSFMQFAEHMFAHHRELHDVHNRALTEYRRVNHTRSKSHPFPDLARDADWFEAPYWVWSNENVRRRRLFVRSKGVKGWEATDREGLFFGPSDGDAVGLIIKGVYLRPRALITTMYARLMLSDLFIHGIGGAKYDELTDLIIRRFFGIEPPAYVTATATFRLPIDRPEISLDEVRQSARRIRELRYRPELFLRDERVRDDGDLLAKLAALTDEKREFLAAHDLRHCSQDVFDHLDRLNRAMHDVLAPVEEELRARHTEFVALAKQSQLLSSREFSFVLFPSEKLPARLLDLSKGVA
jgi:hypothetical protein